MEDSIYDYKSFLEKYEIDDLIYYIRGELVMLDADLSLLYGIETKRLNENVKRNIKRFPKGFCFKLTCEEYNELKTKNATSTSINSHGGRRYPPYVFTEYGIAMLSSILRRSDTMNISIMLLRAIENRKRKNFKREMLDKINTLKAKQLTYEESSDKRFEKIFSYIEGLEGPKQKMFFKGQIYDAYDFFISIIKQAYKKNHFNRCVC